MLLCDQVFSSIVMHVLENERLLLVREHMVNGAVI